jgi:hypothetical protein
MTTTKATTKTKTKAPSVTVRATNSITQLPPNPFMFEILDLASKQKSNVKKVEVLQKYGEPTLKGIFIWNFDDTVVSLLPEGPVPYSGYDEQTTQSGTLSTKITEEIRKMHETGSFSIGNTADAGRGRTTLRREFKNFYHFLRGGNDGINQLRRESMFINILEGLHPLEAEIITLVKDKKLETKYKVTKEIVSAAYPDIIWGGRS